MQLFLNWLLNGRIDDNKYFPKWVLSIARKYSASLAWSVQRDFEEIIDERGVREFIKIHKQTKQYKFGARTVEFIGADDPQKTKGTKRVILYCNEANELEFDWEFFQLFIRTSYRTFIDFNPDDEEIRINTELEQKRMVEEWDVELIVSTYKDNPFLEEWQIHEIERLKEKNPTYYAIYWEWQYGRLEGIIFDRLEVIDEVPEDAQLVAYGLDFGFTNDPSAFVWIYKWNKKLILHEIFYTKGLTNPAIAQKFKDLWIKQEDEIRADSSEPKSIEEINSLGFNIKWVTKWPDSIMYGINTMLSFELCITAKSLNWRKEMRWYVRATDKHQKPLNKPIDKDNHFIDAARYPIMMTLWNKKEIDLFIW